MQPVIFNLYFETERVECNYICKWLDFLVFSDKDYKPYVASRNSSVFTILRNVRGPTYCSKRVGHRVPGVVAGLHLSRGEGFNYGTAVKWVTLLRYRCHQGLKFKWTRTNRYSLRWGLVTWLGKLEDVTQSLEEAEGKNKARFISTETRFLGRNESQAPLKPAGRHYCFPNKADLTFISNFERHPLRKTTKFVLNTSRELDVLLSHNLPSQSIWWHCQQIFVTRNFARIFIDTLC